MTAKMQQMEEKMDKLKKEIQRLSSTNNTTNITNNNTTNITNNFNINPFGKEDMQFLAREIIVDMMKEDDLYHSLQEMIRLTHFNPDHPENMNVYVIDAHPERGHGYCYMKHEWTPMVIKDIVGKLMHNAGESFLDHENNLRGKIKERFERFNQNYLLENKTFNQTMKTIIFSKPIVEDMCIDKPSLTASIE